MEHPPIIDLRNVKTITVIPFEWSGAGRNEHLSRCATSALINGIRRGKIDYVDPQALENISALNYWKYADVYISGRITNAWTNRSNETKEESYWNYYSNKNETVTIWITTITTTVEIEYSYIRSIDGAVLGHFRKSETDSSSYEYSRDRNEYRDLNHGRNPNRNQARNPGRNPGSGMPRLYQQGRGVDTGTAESAIAKFSYTMDHELGPYTTTEKRNIRKSTGNDKRITEANTYIRQGRYDEALILYSDIYKQNGVTATGYNTAVLLAANKKYAEALELLANLNKRTEDSGKRSPSFIQTEINKLTEFINGFKILEAYRKNESFSGANNPVVVPEAAPKAVPGQITGTANINEAVVYALKDSISTAEDPSVFTKLVAQAAVSKGQWSMIIPDGAPSSLWFILIDEGRYSYITKTPLNITAKIVLNTALMNKLEDK